MAALCYSSAALLELLEYQTRYSSPLSYVNLVLTMVTCVIGLIGNAIVIFFNIFVLKKHESKIWFLNLAITDFVSLALLPLHGISVFQGHWSYGKNVCKMFLFVNCANMYASIFILIALNLSRVLSVAKPMFHRKFASQRVSQWVCTTIWLITICASLPMLVFSGEVKMGEGKFCSFFSGKNFGDEEFENLFNITEEWSLENVSLDVYRKFHYIFSNCSQEGCCTSKDVLSSWHHFTFSIQCFVIPLMVIGYFLPFCVIVFSNITIAVQVHKSQAVNTQRLYRIIITIVIIFFVTWTPFILGEMILLAAIRRMNFMVMFKVLTFMPLLCSITYTNCSLNPIMYVLVGRQARTGLAEFLSSIRSS